MTNAPSSVHAIHSKEEFLRAFPRYGYGHGDQQQRARDLEASHGEHAQLEIDRMRMQEFAHMEGIARSVRVLLVFLLRCHST